MERTIICKFLKDPTNGPKLCVVNFTYGSNCENQLVTHNNTNVGDLVTIQVPNLTGDVSGYCFVILACNGTKTVLIEGRLSNTTILGSEGMRGLIVNGIVTCH